jgi:hypothetical protein
MAVTYPGPEVFVDLVHSGQGLLIFILPFLALGPVLLLLLLLIDRGLQGRRVDVRMIVLALAGA